MKSLLILLGTLMMAATVGWGSHQEGKTKQLKDRGQSKSDPCPKNVIVSRTPGKHRASWVQQSIDLEALAASTTGYEIRWRPGKRYKLVPEIISYSKLGVPIDSTEIKGKVTPFPYNKKSFRHPNEFPSYVYQYSKAALELYESATYLNRINAPANVYTDTEIAYAKRMFKRIHPRRLVLKYFWDRVNQSKELALYGKRGGCFKADTAESRLAGKLFYNYFVRPARKESNLGIAVKGRHLRFEEQIQILADDFLDNGGKARLEAYFENSKCCQCYIPDHGAFGTTWPRRPSGATCYSVCNWRPGGRTVVANNPLGMRCPRED